METHDEMHQRLLRLVAASRLSVLPDDYGWLPLSRGAAPEPMAIACVRDDEVWNQLLPVPASHSGPRMSVLSFHFADHISGAGFIAWLAAWIKQEVGTGVVVIGGKDGTRPKNSTGPRSACSITGAVMLSTEPVSLVQSTL